MFVPLSVVLCVYVHDQQVDYTCQVETALFFVIIVTNRDDMEIRIVCLSSQKKLVLYPLKPTVRFSFSSFSSKGDLKLKKMPWMESVKELKPFKYTHEYMAL